VLDRYTNFLVYQEFRKLIDIIDNCLIASITTTFVGLVLSRHVCTFSSCASVFYKIVSRNKSAKVEHDS
jgi:polyferredoxin